MASTRASTSDGTELWPRENRSEDRAPTPPTTPSPGARGEACGDAGVAGRTGRALDAACVEQHQQRVALAAGELEVDVAGEAVLGARLGVPVVDRVRHHAAYAGHQLVAQRGEPSGPARADARRRACRPPRTRRSPAGRSSRTGCRAPGRRRGAGRSASARGVRRARRRRRARRSCGRSRSSRRRRSRRSRAAAGRGPGRRRCAPGCRVRGRSRRPRRSAGRCRPRCWPTSP